MIRIIEPSSHEKYQSEIDILLAIFKKILPSDFKLSPEEKQAMVDTIISKNPAIWADYMQAMGQAIAPTAEAASPAVPSTNPFMKR